MKFSFNKTARLTVAILLLVGANLALGCSAQDLPVAEPPSTAAPPSRAATSTVASAHVAVPSSSATVTSSVPTSTVHSPTTGQSPTTTSARKGENSTTSSSSSPRTTASVSAQPTSVQTKPAQTKPSPAPVVVIDPGHQAKSNPAPEPVGPGSSQTKPKVSSGTSGVVTGIPESQLVLAVGLKLRDALQAHGIKVVMTRTSEDVDLSNRERAQIANKAGAALFVRIHADGADNSATKGIHVLYPASIKGWTDDIAETSRRAAQLTQKHLVATTGAADRGIDARADMTGFNWSDVPVILPEIGFMTNPDEDRLLATESYRGRIVSGLTAGILEFLGLK